MLGRQNVYLTLLGHCTSNFVSHWYSVKTMKVNIFHIWKNDSNIQTRCQSYKTQNNVKLLKLCSLSVEITWVHIIFFNNGPKSQNLPPRISTQSYI